MISAGDFRNGITIELEGNIYQIIEFQHVKPGKGAAFVRTKLKNIKSGGVVEKTFRPTEKCPQARIERKDYQYLYADGDLYYFMDVETYDQILTSDGTVEFKTPSRGGKKSASLKKLKIVKTSNFMHSAWTKVS